ncbi:MAG: hypothetical protein Q8M22_13540 [Actinomycetota bacterium]|nr:hypothetical protein [Actinomycetota bacterium]
MIWLTIGDAATRAGVSGSQIRQARVDGRFPSARRGPAVGRREAPWLISTDDLDAAGFLPASVRGAPNARGRPYLEQQISLLIESSEVLMGRLDSLSDDVRIVALEIRAARESVDADERNDLSLTIPDAEDTSSPLWRRVAHVLAQRLRLLRRGGHAWGWAGNKRN